jgi:hypothetical protein
VNWPPGDETLPIEILSFADHGEAGVFVGTYKGIMFWDRYKGEHTKIWPTGEAILEDTRATAIATHGDNIYVGTFTDGIHSLKVSSSHPPQLHPRSKILDNQGITALKSTTSGVFVGTYRDGLWHLIGEGIQKLQIPRPWRDIQSPVTSIRKVSNETLLATTENQLLLICLEPNRALICAMQSSEGRARMLSAAVSHDDTVHIGTLNHGLLMTNLSDIRRGRPMNASPFEGTEGLSVYSVEGPIENILWLGTNDGLYTANLETNELSRYGKLKGLVNLNFNHGASMVAADQTVFFGGPYGYSRSKTKGMTLEPSQIVKIWLTGIYLDQQRHQNKTAHADSLTLNLRSSNKDLKFQFTVNDYRFPGLNRYKYKLDGYDHDWHSTGRSNSASYTSLPPGDYVFRARGADADGIWSKNEIAIPVHVAVPTWRSWWALALYAILAGTTLLLLRRWHEQLVTQRTRLQLAEESAGAYARLEDDYQAQQEATDYLLQSKTPAALALLTAVQELFSARTTDKKGFENSSTEITIDMLQTLRTVQEVTSRSLSAEATDMHALTDEISARMAQSHPRSADAIIVNDVTSSPIPLSHALLLGLVVHEVLILATSSTRHDDVSPIVRIAMEPAQYNNSSQICYQLSVEDSSQAATDDQRLESYLAFSFHLVESYGGDIEQSYDRGNRIYVRLMLPEDTGRLD